MSQRRPFVAGNWKMNGARAQAAALIDGILAGVSALGDAEVAVCPPFILIPLVAEKLRSTRGRVLWGGQNLDTHPSGAYTGEISGPMLRDFDCTYVIVGHSERRSFYGESDAIVAEKFAAAQAAGLVPILCLGQLLAVLGRSGVESRARATSAYEPVWAIGTGRTATPQQAQDVHRFIRARLA